MESHEEPSNAHYDAIFVGSGIGGLTAAALLARAGRRVLVIERHDRVGGYAHSFRRKRYLFDSAVHMVGGRIVPDLLAALDITDVCNWLPVDPVYETRFPGLRLRVPAGLEAFIDAHTEIFPNQEKGVRGLVQDCRDIRNEIQSADRLQSAMEAIHTPERFPALLRYRRATLADALDAHISDPELAAVLGSLWPYLGLPPSRLSFLYWATMLLSYVEEGAWYCEGTFQNFAQALVDVVVEAGGECLLRSPVERITLADGRVSGVRLESDRRIFAPVVVSGADLDQTVGELVGREHFPRRYLARLGKLTASTSACVLYAAAELDLSQADVAHETFHYTGIDHDAAYAGVVSGEPSWFSATIPTLVDPSLAPAGEHLIVLTTLIDGDARSDWTEQKPRYRDWLLRQAEARIPGLHEGMKLAESGTPKTMERYTLNQRGALYGYDLSPGQVGPGRPDHITPVPGLYLAGHWTRPGGGITGVVTSGVQAARKILGLASDAELLFEDPV